MMLDPERAHEHTAYTLVLRDIFQFRMRLLSVLIAEAHHLTIDDPEGAFERYRRSKAFSILDAFHAEDVFLKDREPTIHDLCAVRRQLYQALRSVGAAYCFTDVDG